MTRRRVQLGHFQLAGEAGHRRQGKGHNDSQYGNRKQRFQQGEAAPVPGMPSHKSSSLLRRPRRMRDTAGTFRLLYQ
ncbi:hypothetical protein SDC9_164257 [bioreactor metagenome]|uniref:Uncharacterized protein n=1 Tax=bioreactor metagenome TaxID=1076179 RepID=A0A645FSP0_9ZZZZ